jgi:hypothetical protein
MKKLSLLLVALLMLSMLAGCKNEAGATEQLIPGYSISLPVGDGWTVIEKEADLEASAYTNFDLQLEKKGIQLVAVGFAPQDFVDLPLAEDLYLDGAYYLDDILTEVSEDGEPTTYEAKGKTILSGMFTGKDGDTEKKAYCFLVDFGADTYNMAWVAFIAKDADIKKNKDAFKAIVDGMTCTAEPYDFESSLDDELYFDEDGNLITDETEPLEGPGETYPEEVAESNPPAPTTEDTPSTTEEVTVPATTAPAETTEETKTA